MKKIYYYGIILIMSFNLAGCAYNSKEQSNDVIENETVIDEAKSIAEKYGLKNVSIEFDEENAENICLLSSNFRNIEWEDIFELNEELIEVEGIKNVDYTYTKYEDSPKTYIIDSDEKTLTTTNNGITIIYYSWKYTCNPAKEEYKTKEERDKERKRFEEYSESLTEEDRKNMEESAKEYNDILMKKWSEPNTTQKVEKLDPMIGMSKEEAENSSWGKPDDINKTTYAWGVHEQWCYSNHRYLYFENGEIVAIQE